MVFPNEMHDRALRVVGKFHRHLRAVFAGAAAEQEDARRCHGQKAEMTLDHVYLLGWMHGVSLLP